jgi:DNA/RNA-binding domain of Phe-tRNA-synthetase-like protein
MEVHNELKEAGLMAGIVRAEGVRMKPSPEELLGKIRSNVEKTKRQEFPPPELRACIRTLLKKGGFKATGRNKPASEYLAQAAREGRFPFLNNLVDIGNCMSLISGLPVSLLDLDVVGDSIVLRLGKAGERFVFNASGQEIDVEGLISVCRAGGGPLGNPVKDSMEAKVTEGTRRLIGVIYTSEACTLRDDLESCIVFFAQMLRDCAEAGETEVLIV